MRRGDKKAKQNLNDNKSPNVTSDHETEKKQQLGGSELFSFFTANIIKEGKVFTR